MAYAVIDSVSEGNAGKANWANGVRSNQEDFDGRVTTLEGAGATCPDPIVPADGTQNITGDLTVSGAVEGASLTDGTLTATAGSITSAVDITVSGTVTAEQLTSTDDINATDAITAGGVVTGATLTDGAFSSTAGTVTGAVDITASGTITGEQLTSTDDINATDAITAGGTVTGATLTDGTLSINAGSITSAVNGTFGSTVQAEQLTSTDDINATGTVTGATLTDGTLSINSGSISSGVNATFSGTITGDKLYADTIADEAGTGVPAFPQGLTSVGTVSAEQLTSTDDINATGTVTGATLTDGTLSVNAGSIASGVNATFSGTITSDKVYADTIYDEAGTGAPTAPYGMLLTGIQTITAVADTLVLSDHIALLNATSNAVTVTLPAVAGNTGKWYVLKAINIDNIVTIDGNAAETIDGAATYAFGAVDECIHIICDGTEWHVTAAYYTDSPTSPLIIDAIQVDNITNKAGTQTPFLGLNAGAAMTTGSNNIIFGNGAGQTMTGWDTQGNVVIGHDAANAWTGDVTQSYYNVFVGHACASLWVNPAFFRDNVAIGTDAFQGGVGTVQSIRNNIAIGKSALKVLNASSAMCNVAVGSDAMSAAVNGANNVAVGNGAMTGSASTAGDYNLALGYRSLYSATSCCNAVAIGNHALYSSTTGANIGIGYEALKANIAGQDNVCIGKNVADAAADAGFDNNVAIGSNAMGAVNGATTNNIAIGHDALLGSAATVGSDNIALGNEALHDITSAQHAIGIGTHSLAKHTSGNHVVGLGRYSGYTNTTAGNLFFVGGWDGVSVQVPLDHRWEVTTLTADHHVDDFQVNRETDLELVLQDDTDGVMVDRFVNAGSVLWNNVQTITAATDTLNNSTDHIVLLDANGNAVTATLPAAAGNTGLTYVLKAINIDNLVTIDGNAAETIDGVATFVFTSLYEAITIICDGSNWHII